MPRDSYKEAYEYEQEESYGYEDDEDDEDFEDDEDDESFEDDEDDEDDEAFEDDEDDEDDEAFEDDEDDESFEDDEDDESFGESKRSRARARAQAQARVRARQQAAARQAVAARRASATSTQLNRKVMRIRGAKRTKSGSLRQVRGSAIVTATLPNGRRTRMRLTPAPAPASEVNRLRAQILANDKRSAAATAANAKAIANLSKAQAEAVKKMTAEQVKSDKALSKRIVDGDTKLDKRLTTELAKIRAERSKGGRGLRAALKRERRRSLWNNVLIASSLPFFSAYGDVDNPFSRDNLILTGSLAGWLLGDEILDRVTGGRKGGKKGKGNKTLRRGSDLWSYLAPVGNAATVWWLMKDRQHVRFLTGTTSVTYGPGSTPTDLALEVAEDYQEDFNALSGNDAPRVVATIVSNDGSGTGVTAQVVGGRLQISIVGGTPEGVMRTAVVAWVVDTRANAGREST